MAQGVDATLELLVGLEADLAYAADLRAQVAEHGLDERVRFAGQRSDVARRLLAADALLLPAGEVTPLVLMEAMAHGTPVIAARMGSIADVVGDDGHSGLLIAPDDAAAMPPPCGGWPTSRGWPPRFPSKAACASSSTSTRRARTSACARRSSC